tara:strand:+ start:151 stop:621 length:471 start_codon:yes stop_codon:yes gene_type:complete
MIVISLLNVAPINAATNWQPPEYKTVCHEKLITLPKLEPELFLAITGLTVADFYLLIQFKVFNTEQMKQAILAFCRHEGASRRYTGVDSHSDLTQIGWYETVVAANSSALRLSGKIPTAEIPHLLKLDRSQVRCSGRHLLNHRPRFGCPESLASTC